MKSSFYANITYLILTSAFIWMTFMVKNASTADLGQSCTTSGDCTNYLSYCSDEKKCKCLGWTVTSDKRCLSEYNNFCILSGGGGCTTANAECKVVNFTQKCLCKENYEFHLEKNECFHNIGFHSSRPSVLLLLLMLCVTILLSCFDL